MDSGGHDEIKHWAGRHCGNCDLSDLDNNGYGNMTVVTGRRGRGRKRRIVASGSTIDVTCDHGNQFEKLPNLQSLTITCERGQYYNVIPCEPKSCTRPRVGNASIRKARKTIEHGKTITVECLPGYGLPDGTVTIDLTCHLGQFEPEAPETCDDWRCVLSELVHNNYMPLEDEHGRLMTSLASGDTLTATCKTGYHLLDNGTQERLELQCDTGTIQHATPCDLRGCELTDDASNAAVFPEDELMNNTNITPYVNSSTEIESAISQVQWSEPQDFRELRLVIVDSLRMRKTVIFADHKCPCTAKHIPVLNQTEVTLVDLARLKQSLEVKKQQAAQEEFLNQQQQQLLLQEAAQERQQHQHQQQQQQLLQYHSHQYHELMYLLQQHPDEQHQHYLQQLLQQYQKQKHYMRHQQAAEEELLNQKHLQQQQLLQQQQQQQHQQHELLQQDQQQQHPVEQRTALQQLLLQLQQTLQQPHTAEEELLNQQQLQHQHQHHCSLEKGCLYDSMSLYGDDPPTPEQQVQT